MWFEILPSFGIVVAALAMPHALSYVVNKVAVGNMYRRRVTTFEERMGYLRDKRLGGGSPYIVRGLEAIPDL